MWEEKVTVVENFLYLPAVCVFYGHAFHFELCSGLGKLP